MTAGEQPDAMSIAQIGHHIGLHVSVNIEGKQLGSVLVADERWVTGVVIGMGGLGDYVTIKLDEPVGAEEGHGFLHRGSRGEDKVMIDDPAKIRAMSLAEAQPGGVPDEIADLVRAGKTLEALKRYRALNGATLDEARAAIAKLQSPL